MRSLLGGAVAEPLSEINGLQLAPGLLMGALGAADLRLDEHWELKDRAAVLLALPTSAGRKRNWRERLLFSMRSMSVTVTAPPSPQPACYRPLLRPSARSRRRVRVVRRRREGQARQTITASAESQRRAPLRQR